MKAFKTPFVTSPAVVSQQAAPRRVQNRLTQSCRYHAYHIFSANDKYIASLELDLSNGDMQVLAQCSQKIGVSALLIREKRYLTKSGTSSRCGMQA